MAKHEIQFSEPWDFQHPNGTNKFSAVGLGVVTGPDKDYWQGDYYLLEVEEPFQMAGDLVSQLICSPRYAGDTLQMVMSSSCTVGIARVKPAFKLSPGVTINTNEVSYCAIGSVKTI